MFSTTTWDPMLSLVDRGRAMKLCFPPAATACRQSPPLPYNAAEAKRCISTSRRWGPENTVSRPSSNTLFAFHPPPFVARNSESATHKQVLALFGSASQRRDRVSPPTSVCHIEERLTTTRHRMHSKKHGCLDQRWHSGNNCIMTTTPTSLLHDVCQFPTCGVATSLITFRAITDDSTRHSEPSCSNSAATTLAKSVVPPSSVSTQSVATPSRVCSDAVQCSGDESATAVPPPGPPAVSAAPQFSTTSPHSSVLPHGSDITEKGAEVGVVPPLDSREQSRPDIAHTTVSCSSPINANAGESMLPGAGTVTAKSTTTVITNAASQSQDGKPERPSDALSANRDLTPSKMVEYLDKYIVGQLDAKKAIANALRNRWRRLRLDNPSLKGDIVPRNILMIGPTGVGKTEIARRLSKLVDAPFIKVEATKFTEVGFHGRDVEQIIKDLVEIAVKRQRAKVEAENSFQAEEIAEQRILEALLGKLSREDRGGWLNHLRGGLLDDRMITVDMPVAQQSAGVMSVDPVENAIREALSSYSNVKSVKVVQQGNQRLTEKKSLTVKEARQKLTLAEMDAMIDQEALLQNAITAVEQEGIVFIDEIDKICTKSHGGYSGPDASAEGVQRDLLPLIEGSSVSTRYGNINTDYILFIASGAFHNVKPSDMLAELQGRLPVRVELKPLDQQDFVRILKEPQNNLLHQNKVLLQTEGLDVSFTDDAVEEIARVSCEVNTHAENIGARRLHTILEKIMEEISYTAPEMEPGHKCVIDAAKVRDSVGEFLRKSDLHKYIL